MRRIINYSYQGIIKKILLMNFNIDCNYTIKLLLIKIDYYCMI